MADTVIDWTRHPIVLASRGSPSDQQEAAMREAAEVEAMRAAVEALSTDDPEARRVIRDAAVRLGTLYNRYAASAGYLVPSAESFAGWFHRNLVALRGAAIRCLGETEGRRLINVGWKPVP